MTFAVCPYSGVDLNWAQHVSQTWSTRKSVRRLAETQSGMRPAASWALITWDEMEACQLISTAPFDLILVGDHPPELNAAAILDDLSLRGTCPPVLILRRIFGEENFRRRRCRVLYAGSVRLG